MHSKHNKDTPQSIIQEINNITTKTKIIKIQIINNRHINNKHINNNKLINSSHISKDNPIHNNNTLKDQITNNRDKTPDTEMIEETIKITTKIVKEEEDTIKEKDTINNSIKINSISQINMNNINNNPISIKIREEIENTTKKTPIMKKDTINTINITKLLSFLTKIFWKINLKANKLRFKKNQWLWSHLYQKFKHLPLLPQNQHLNPPNSPSIKSKTSSIHSQKKNLKSTPLQK